MRSVAVIILVAILSLTFAGLATRPAVAVTPPDDCFNFTWIGITDYYSHRANNPANAACPRDVDIPATIGGVGVTRIHNQAFMNQGLTSVTIPLGVTTIGVNSFFRNKLTTIVIPASVTSVEGGAFVNNHDLTSITITNPATVIATGAFSVESVTAVTIGTTTYTEQIPATHPACFTMTGSTLTRYNRRDLNVVRDHGVLCGREVVVPSGVTSIGSGAFQGSGATTVTLPSTLTTIGSNAFGASRLTSITVPGGVTSIGEAAFIGNNLSSVFIEGDPVVDTTAFFMQQTSHFDLFDTTGIFDRLTTTFVYAPHTTTLQNHITYESDLGIDLNSDGDQTDIIGVHLVNPTPLTIRHLDAQGNQLRPHTTLYGDGIADQRVATLTALHPGVTSADLANIYYFAGSTTTQTPPAIAGYTAPAAQSHTFAAGSNTLTFTYTAAGGGAAVGTPSAPKAGVAPSISLTGVVVTFVGLTLASIGAGVVVRTGR